MTTYPDDRTPDRIYEDFLNESAEPDEDEESMDVREEPSAVQPLSDADQATVDRILAEARDHASLVEFVFRPQETGLTFLITPDTPRDAAQLAITIQETCDYPARIYTRDVPDGRFYLVVVPV